MNEEGSPQQPGANYLAVLLRLWTLRRAARLPAAAALPLVFWLSAAWLLLWLFLDWQYAQPDPQFFADNIPLFAWYALAILTLAAVLRWRCRPTPAFVPVLALSLGLVPVPLLVMVAAPYLSTVWFEALALGASVYSLLYLARGLAAFSGKSQRGAALAGILFMLGFVWLTAVLDVIPDVWEPREVATTAQADAGVDAESALFEQSGRIDQALEAIGKESSPSSKAFFLGFAGVGDEKVFAQEIGLASRVLGERYAIHGRGLSLINDERDLGRAPLASVSGLKYALRGLAERMNLDHDVLFLSISSHGAKDPAIIVANSQLPLNDLTDVELAEVLAESGIKWRVIVISACYAGAFIDSLKNEQTIVIAAAAADRTSFGCSNDRDLTYFGEAFYRDALPGARSLREAFDKAKTAIAARERREHVEPSKPQAYFGTALEAKLSSMNITP